MDSQRDALEALEEYRLEGWREVGRELGRGSYAAVVEVDYKGLRCAAKKIHRSLYEQGIGNLVSRFEQECRLLSQLRHPHVVQFLGIYFDSDSNLPVLVMEFLPTTLAQCLDTYGVLPEEINYGILQDVALGLRYLHERPQPIVHRDLSANNVLLTSDMRGKISDLGVAKILAAQRSRMTPGPGTLLYMPPEALVPNPRYDVKVDIFSYGVMMVHSLCGRWPFPGESVRANPENPHDLTPVSEVSRRQEYLDDIPRDHPLMELIHLCLTNGPAHRPDASSVAKQVSEAAPQSPPSYNKVEMMDRIRLDAEQREELQRDNETLIRERDVAVSQQEAKSLEVEDLKLQVANLAADVTRAHESIACKDEALNEKDRLYQQALQQKEQVHKQAFERQDEMLKYSLKLKDEEQARNDHTYKLTLQQKDEELIEKDRAYQQALELKDTELTHRDQAHRQALQQKDRAHQQAFELKYWVHRQALQLKDEELAQKDHAHTQVLQQKDRAHQQALQLKDDKQAQKDRAHTEAVAEIERAHREAMALKDKSHQTELQARQTELTLLQQELASSRDSTSQKQETISHLRDQLRRCRSHLASNQQANLLTTPGAKLVWRECAECPFALDGAQAVVISGIVYVGGGVCARDAERCTVCRYHPGEDKWAKLPPSPVMYFGIGQVSGQLVLVGGMAVLTRKVTGDVHVLTSESQQWEKSIPAIPTARCEPSVVSHLTVLVACGGRDQGDKSLPTVELYSSEASQWYQCPPLPSPHRFMTSVAIGDTLFLLGEYFERTTKVAFMSAMSVASSPVLAMADRFSISTSPINTSAMHKSVFSASLSTLIDRAIHHSTGSARRQQLWTILKIVPYYRSTAASVGGCLLALGGMDRPDRGQTSASIHIYLPTFSTWHQIGELPLPLRRSTAVLLPTNELLIIGGVNKDGHMIKDVYKGSVEV